MRMVIGTLVAGLCVAACDTNRVGGNPAMLEGGAQADLRYPEGPFGVANGDVIDNFTFAGYFSRSSTVGPDMAGFEEAIDFQAVRTLGRYRFMLLNIAAEWCTGCRVEAQLLPQRFRDWDERGGYVFSVIIEDSVSRQATKRNLDRWLQTYPINYTMVHDPFGNINSQFAPPGLPLNVIIDLETMEIRNQKVGEDLRFLDIFDSLLE